MPAHSTLDPVNTLEELNPIILHLARQNIPRKVLNAHVLDLEIDDLVQNTRIKLWQALQRGNIVTPLAYVKRILYTEVVNIVRRHEKTVSLSIDEVNEVELYQENALVAASEGMQDPSYELEREETFADCVNTIVHLIATLPSCQRDAMICALKDQREETFPVLDALRDQQVDIEARQWPEQKAATLRLRSSLCVARKKMRTLYNASVHQASAR